MISAPPRPAPQLTVDLAVPSLWVDERGLIRVLPRQFHSRAELVGHFASLKSMIASVRARSGRVRVLVDLRGSNVLDPEGGKVIQGQIAKLYLPQDRLALVVSSQLVRLQSRRLLGATTVRQFDSLSDAESWLDDQPVSPVSPV